MNPIEKRYIGRVIVTMTAYCALLIASILALACLVQGCAGDYPCGSGGTVLQSLRNLPE